MAVVGDEALLGHVLNGRYRIVERIARGGMASVFLADDTRLDRRVAVKVMHQGLGDTQQFTERFRREAKSAAKLNHRNVVAVFDQGTDGDITYLVMEYVPGRTLRDVMRQEAPMPSLRALDLIEQVLIALSAAHEAHLVHRDVKPENVLITPSGEVKVADFGLARAVSSSTTATGNALIGTVSYLAPEIVVNAGTDARSDVYAVGAVLYEMLTGIKPHHADTPIQVAYKHVHEDIGAPSDLRPGLPEYVDALVARATARDRDSRSADAHVLLQQVRRVQHALRAGVDEDDDLVADLMPGHRGANNSEGDTDGEDTAIVAVGAAPSPPSGADADALTESVALSGPEHTVVWGGGSPTVVGAPAPSSPSDDRPLPGAAPHPPKKTGNSSRRGQILLLVALLATVLVALLGWYFGIGRYEDTPNLVNMTEQQAAADAEEAGFAFEVESREFSETIPNGTVISTDPSAGDRILPGDTIAAVVSKGQERYTVPDLRGKTPEEATKILADLKLELGDLREAFDQEVPQGQIITIEGVEVGALVKRDTVVDVVVSKGREPLEVTDYTGKSRETAVAGLEATGFVVAAPEEFSDDVPPGTVIRQDPASGTALRGDTITIVVSKGPELFAVPDVVGKTRDEAIAALEAAGFVAETGVLTGNRNFTVRLQSPAAGTMARKGTTVTIVGF